MTKLIVALDTEQAELAKAWVRRLGPGVTFYKVGMELFTVAGPSIVTWLKEQDKQVFLDLKYHDIPNTASRAVKAAARLGVDLCTIHAAGGEEMLRACREHSGNTQLLAVTVLTSFDVKQLKQVGFDRPLGKQVRAMAELAHETGIHGVICAPTDLDSLRELPQDFLRVTPGIRPAGSSAGDQRRIMTPNEAAHAGASHIVVGRPITQALDPALAAQSILAQLEG